MNEIKVFDLITTVIKVFDLKGGGSGEHYNCWICCSTVSDDIRFLRDEKMLMKEKYESTLF